MRKALTLSGSVRTGSLNWQLAELMGQRMRDAGAEVNNINLAEFPMPLFDEAIEETSGAPEHAVALAELFAGADAIFIASPEYNGSVSPLLKNTIDWVSRQKNRPYKSAIFGIGAVSPGKLSGMAGLSHLRDILGRLGALIAPVTLGVGHGAQVFDENGQLNEIALNARADELAMQLMCISRGG